MDPSNDNSLSDSLEHGHEVSRVDARVLWLSAIGLFVLIVATFFLIDGVMRLFAAISPPAAPVPPERAAMRLPAGAPPLDVNQAAELKRVLAQQRAVLDELGWVDRSAGIARIPIAEAMAITAKQGLPAIQSAEASEEGNSNE